MRLPPDAGQLAPLRRSLADWLAHAEVEPNASAALVLATHEAAANAIEHAQAEVVVAVSRDRGRMTVVVRSAGGWKESDEDEYRGRGLILMARLDVAGRGRIASGRISRPDAAVALSPTLITESSVLPPRGREHEVARARCRRSPTPARRSALCRAGGSGSGLFPPRHERHQRGHG
jgi:hypothetical protein